jgi:hypothetical protein
MTPRWLNKIVPIDRWRPFLQMARTKIFWINLWKFTAATTRRSVVIAAAGFLAATLLVLIFGGGVAAEGFGFLVCALAAIYVAGRYFLKPKTPGERALFVVALLVLFVGTLWHENRQTIGRMYSRGAVRTWNIYHYYLGSKYFPELGYTGLYPQTIVADREGRNWLKDVKAIRDMTDYQVKPVPEIVPAQRAPGFSDARWDEFKRDVNVLLAKEPRRQWGGILADRGYNPTPFWNAVGAIFSRALDVTNPAQLAIAVSLDLALYFIMIAAAWWAFGAEASMLAFLCFALLPFNPPRLIGGYIQYDWIAAIVLGVCFVQKRRPIPAAIALGYATMAKVFPLLLVGGLAFPAVRRLVTEKKLDQFTWKFGIAFAAVCLLGLGVGATSGKGLGGWTEWREKITTHNYEMIFGQGRVGLQHIFTHRLGDEFETSEKARKRSYEGQSGAYYAAAVLFLALFLAAVWRRSNLNALLLSTMLVYIFLVPSHYYWSILSILPFWRVKAGKRWSPALLPALTAFIVPAGWYAYALSQRFEYARFIMFDWLLGLCFLAVTGWLIVVNLHDMNLWPKKPA